ncbi:MAG: hypothetical protein WEA99_08745 [Brumimicrobium sp.]
MAKNKTTFTGVKIDDFLDSYVDNEQKKADSLQLIKLMSEWSGFDPKCGAIDNWFRELPL